MEIDLTAPQVNGAPDPNWHYAVVVGIDAYPALPSLTGARSDALAFREWLLKSGVPERNIRVVVSDPKLKFNGPDEAIPTRQLVDAALRELMVAVRHDGGHAADAWERTRLYVYLAGHGMAGMGAETAVLMANARLEVLGDSIPASLYMRYFEDAQLFHEVVFFADCCRVPNLTLQPLGPPFGRVLGQNGQVRTVLGLATEFGTYSYESTREASQANAARGHFTRALLEGLDGRAVDPESRQIDSSSLAKYLRRRVTDLTSSVAHARQVAQVIAEQGLPVVFAVNLDVPTWRVEIQFPPEWRGGAILRSSTEIEHCKAVGELWTVHLPDGLYEVVAEDGTVFAQEGLFRVKGASRVVQL